jgi:hypothetical protein
MTTLILVADMPTALAMQDGVSETDCRFEPILTRNLGLDRFDRIFIRWPRETWFQHHRQTEDAVRAWVTSYLNGRLKKDGLLQYF